MNQKTIKKIAENPNLITFCNKILSYNAIFENEYARNMFIVSLISSDTMVDEISCDATIETAEFILKNIDMFILEDKVKNEIIKYMKKAIKIAKRDKKIFQNMKNKDV